MNWNRFGRCLVCLLVIAALLINIMPQEAEASVGGTVGMLINAYEVITSVMIGLGVLPEMEAPDFMNVVADCFDWLSENTGMILQKSINVAALVDGNGKYQYLVEDTLVDFIRQFLFLKGIVSVESTSTVNSLVVSDLLTGMNGLYFGINLDLSTCNNMIDMMCSMTENDIFVFSFREDSKRYCGLFWDDSGRLSYCNQMYKSGNFDLDSSMFCIQNIDDWVMQNSPFQLKYNNGFFYRSVDSIPVEVTGACNVLVPSETAGDGLSFLHRDSSGVWNSSVKHLNVVNSLSTTFTYPDYSTAVWDKTVDYEASTEYAVNLGFVPPSDVLFQDGYKTWADNSVSISGSVLGSEEEEIQVYPIGLGQTLEETQQLTQEQIWAGESTYVQEQEQIEGTFADTLVQDFLEELTQIVLTPVNLVLEGLKNLFIPSQGYFQEQVQALRQEYAVFDSASRFGLDLKSFFLTIGQKPPIIYIDLDASDSSYDYGGRAVCFDLTWFAEYKPITDGIISAFLWLWFVWRLLLNLPSIIAGTSGFWGSPDPYAGFSPMEFAPRRLNPGSVKELGTSEYRHKFNGKGRFYDRD